MALKERNIARFNAETARLNAETARLNADATEHNIDAHALEMARIARQKERVNAELALEDRKTLLANVCERNASRA